MLRMRWFFLPALAFVIGLPSGARLKAQEPSTDAKKDEAPAVKEAKKEPEPPKPKVAVFRLAGPLRETPKEEVFNFGGETGTDLQSLVSRLDKAAKDQTVKAVVILLDSPAIGASQAEELRQAIGRIRDAGKEVIAHADTISSLGYYGLLTAANRLSVVPTADLWVTGIYGEAPYLRGLLDKLGVKPDFLTCGDYKSAAEMFMREGPSKEAESMQNWLLDSLFDSQVQRIATSRKVSAELVKAWIDSSPHSAEKAKELGMLDAVEHRQDLENHLKTQYGANVVFDRKYGKKADPKLDASSPLGLFKFWGELLGASKAADSKKPAIGIVYVEGPITLGSAPVSLFDEQGAAASTPIRRALDAAAADDTIKGVVLRVDSPGGSALASEIILDATRRVKAKKPFTVSMGNVAGSGGYYVACAADTIFADETTITGSIGVVGGKIATGGLTDKLGVRFKSYRRGQNAGLLSSADVFTPAEKQKMQTWMNEIYGVFKGHVQAIRGDRLKKPLDDLAGGRVYTGKQALELGLIDKIGTLHDAVKLVAEKANLTDYDVRVVPKPKSILEQLMDDDSNDSRKGLDVAHKINLIDLAQPLLRSIDPARADLIRAAMARLELINREGVILMMPELGLSR